MFKHCDLAALVLAGMAATLPATPSIAKENQGTQARSVEDRLSRALDVQAIQNVMSRHAYYYASGQHQRELDELFAMNMPDVSWAQDSGWWVGAKSLQNYYVDFFDVFRKRDLVAFNKLHPEIAVTKENLGAGTSMFHTNSTPVIEVAGDRKTAKGLWYSVGQVMQTPGGRQTPVWMWERYAVDFIRQGDKWKIWHILVKTDFSAGPGDSWAADIKPDGADMGAAAAAGQAGEAGDAPVPDVKGTRPERPTGAARFAKPEEYPRVPMPYQTFSETFSYGPPSTKQAAR